MFSRCLLLVWLATIVLARGEQVAVEGGNLKIDLPAGLTPLSAAELETRFPIYPEIEAYGTSDRKVAVCWQVFGTVIKPEEVAGMRDTLPARMLQSDRGMEWIKSDSAVLGGTTWAIGEFIGPSDVGRVHDIAAFTSYHGLLLRVDVVAPVVAYPQWRDSLDAILHSLRLTDGPVAAGAIGTPDEETSRGQVALTAYELDDADAHFQAALRQKPGLYSALVGEGRIEGQRENYGKALSYFDQAVEGRPLAPPAYFERAWVNRRLGDYVAAESDGHKLLDLEPHAPGGYLALANLDLDRGDFPAALKMIAAVLKQNPHSAPAFRALGWMYFRQGKRALAVRVFTAVQSLAPKIPSGFYSAGEVLLSEEKWQLALDDLNHAMQLAPNDNQTQDARLLKWAARHYLGEGEAADAELDAYLKDTKAFKTPWVLQSGAFLLKRESESEFLARMHEPNRQRDHVGQDRAWFFIGLRARVDGDWSASQQAFLHCTESLEAGDDCACMARGFLHNNEALLRLADFFKNYGFVLVGCAALYVLGIGVLLALFVRNRTALPLPAGA